MNRRSVVGAGVAVAALALSGIGAVLPVTAVTGYAQLTFSPAPIAPNGSLSAGQAVTVCVQAKDSGGNPLGGQSVDLSLDNPAIPQDIPTNAAETGGMGTATVVTPGPSTALTSTPALFTTPTGAATCTPTGSTATEANAIKITYTAPDIAGSTNNGAPFPIWGGRDSVLASDPNNPSDSTDIQYEFSPVTQYVYSVGSTVAPSGSLGAGQQVSLTVAAENATGNDIPCAQLLLSLSSTASPAGSALAASGGSAPDGCPQIGNLPLGSTPLRFITNASGQIQITYTAASPLPVASGQDTVTAQNHPSVVTLSLSTSYTYLSYGGGYTVDAYGGLHPFADAPYEAVSADYPGFNIIRGVVLDSCDPSGHSGWTVDGYGGMHQFGAAPFVTVYGGYYPGWDIIRGAVAWCDQGHAVGYTVDAYGGMHPFSDDPGVVEPPYPQVTGYWAGQELTAGIALIPGTDEGYVVDAYGGLHPFNGAPYYNVSAYYPGFNIIRGVTLLPGGGGGYTLDAYGGLHPFGSAPYEPVSGYYPGWDIMRGVVASSATGGYTLDAYGGLHPYGTALYEAVTGYYPGQNLIVGVVFAPGT
jgi:hypothetical protein